MLGPPQAPFIPARLRCGWCCRRILQINLPPADPSHASLDTPFANDPPTLADMEVMRAKVNELIAALRR